METQEDNLYSTYDRTLYKTGVATYPGDLPAQEVTANSLFSATVDQIAQQPAAGTTTIIQQQAGGQAAGKTKFDNTEVGYILGIDKSIPKFYIGNTTDYLNWTGTQLVISGSLTATSGTIGAFEIGSNYLRDVANSFGLSSAVTGGDDIRFWAGDTLANIATADLRIHESGWIEASNLTATGGSISAGVTVALGALNIAARGWTQTSVFSITDADTIAWGAGTFTSADGTAYSISAGNTGNMAAKTYIYLDTGVSTTVYQTTTTAATAVGAGKALIATAQNATGEAIYTVLAGQGGQNIDATSIVANSITANELSTSITYAGSIIIDTVGLIRSGQTAYNTGIGWWLGNNAGSPDFSIGDPAGNRITWKTSTGVLTIVGTTSNIQIFTGSGTWTKPTTPTPAKIVEIIIIGGGGGGGKYDATVAGGGGGGGAINALTKSASLITPTVAVTIGAGGKGQDGTAADDGGDTTFGSYLTAGGGKKAVIGSEGLGGTATGGISGGAGGAGQNAGALTGGGGGGAGGSAGTAGSSGGAGGVAGTTFTSLGAGGDGGDGTPTETGGVGNNYGGGGGGAGDSANGGAGAGGYAVITTFF